MWPVVAQPPPQFPWFPPDPLTLINHKLDALAMAIHRIETSLNSQGATLVKELEDLKAAVAANSATLEHCKSAVASLKASLDAAIAQLPDKSALVALSAQLAADDKAAEDAVASATPPTP